MTEMKITTNVRGRPTQDGAGVKLSRVIGQPGLPRLDPFLMLDEFGSDQAADYLPGFPPHPHRGFQTVTYMLKGKMRHRDSVGNDGLIESGGIQWMNAGRGIIHEEMPEQTEGELRGFQLWVNLPASHKMSAPGYQDITADRVPHITLNDAVSCRLLSGKLEGKSGPVTTIDDSLSVPFFADFHGNNGEWQFVADPEFQYFCYCYAGELTIADQSLTKGELGVLSKGSHVTFNSSKDTSWILVGGKPIGEPIAQYGPFVMNTEQEIHQAITDYQNGTLATTA